jgi:hypothetical protein
VFGLLCSGEGCPVAVEAALDGFYVLRSSVPAAALDAPATVLAYKGLAQVERAFRSLGSIDRRGGRSAPVPPGRHSNCRGAARNIPAATSVHSRGRARHHECPFSREG